MTLNEHSTPEEVMEKLQGAALQGDNTPELVAWAQKLAMLIQSDCAIKSKQHLDSLVDTTAGIEGQLERLADAQLAQAFLVMSGYTPDLTAKAEWLHRARGILSQHTHHQEHSDVRHQDTGQVSEGAPEAVEGQDIQSTEPDST